MASPWVASPSRWAREATGEGRWAPLPFPCRARGAGGGASRRRACAAGTRWCGCGAAAPLARRGEQRPPPAPQRRAWGARGAAARCQPRARHRPRESVRTWSGTAGCPLRWPPLASPPPCSRRASAPPRGQGGAAVPLTAGRGRSCFAAILSQGPWSIGMSRIELPGNAVRVWECRRRVPATRSSWDCRWRAKHLSPRPGRRASVAQLRRLWAPRLLQIRGRAPARVAHPAPNPPEALLGGARALPRKASGILMFNLIQASRMNASLPC